MSLSFSFKLLLSLILACMSVPSLADRITQPIPIDSVSGVTDHTRNNSAQTSTPVSSDPISARGVVLQVDQSNATIKINHDPIAALDWPRMTMPFRLKERSLADKIKKGDIVEFFLEKEASDYVIVKLNKRNSTRSSQ
ncbi:MAG: copper-binding protein [Nitrosomonas sp.]|nr:copper-binding protein [Nitrosomonas sp.]MDP1950116.1 copper-binding protein [Nitrosomonas sp.]